MLDSLNGDGNGVGLGILEKRLSFATCEFRVMGHSFLATSTVKL